MMGTPDYCSPEQLQDAKNVDHRTDIYSLGATFYEMVTGNNPKYYREEHIPAGFLSLIKKAMAANPGRRYQNVSEFIDAFEGRVEDEESTEVKIACPQCGLRNPTDVKYCIKCGSSLSHLFDQCPKCQRENRIDIEYCGGCGYNVYNYRKIQRLTDKALKLREQQKYTEAIGNWERILEIEPDNQNASKELAIDKETVESIEKLCNKLEQNRTKHDWPVIVSTLNELVKVSQERAAGYKDLKDETEAHFRGALQSCIKKDDYWGAIKIVETLMKLNGETDELRNSINDYNEQAKEISDLTTWARNILYENPKQALTRVKEIRFKYPQNQEITSLIEEGAKAIITDQESKFKVANEVTEKFRQGKKSISEAINVWGEYLNVSETTEERSLAEKTLEQLNQDKAELEKLLRQLENEFESKRYDIAIELIKQIREIQKGNPRCLEVEKDIRARIEEVEEHKRKAQEAIKELDYEKALLNFQAALSIDPRNQALREEMRKAAEILEALNSEIKELKTRLEKKEDLEEELQRILELVIRYPKYEQLLLLRDQMTQQQIRNLLSQGEACLLSKEFGHIGKAIQKFEKVLVIKPEINEIKQVVEKLTRIKKIRKGVITFGLVVALATFCTSILANYKESLALSIIVGIIALFIGALFFEDKKNSILEGLRDSGISRKKHG